MARQLLYFADPMCSWCWGFAPVIEAVAARFGPSLPVRLILGGLRPGTTEPLIAAGKRSIREHWQHVQELAGQPFDFGFFEREGFVYDTEPPCRAVVAARRLRPGAALGFLDHLHGAFYSRNQDITDATTLAGLAADFGFDPAEFEAVFAAAATREETRADFALGKRIGIGGFPALLAGGGDDAYSIVTLGYQPWGKIEPLVTSWLEHVAGTTAR
jgi:putative protein-disulfide isomerase